jgi:hypothetical protein
MITSKKKKATTTETAGRGGYYWWLVVIIFVVVSSDVCVVWRSHTYHVYFNKQQLLLLCIHISSTVFGIVYLQKRMTDSCVHVRLQPKKEEHKMESKQQQKKAKVSVTVGSKVPPATLHYGFPPKKVSLHDRVASKKVILIGLPVTLSFSHFTSLHFSLTNHTHTQGAFTPT